MAKQVINIGTSVGDLNADLGRVAMDKINDNFTELYAADVTLQGNIDNYDDAAHTWSQTQTFTGAISSSNTFATSGNATLSGTLTFISKFLRIGGETNKDIASGAFTPTSSFHSLTGEEGSADDLDTITGTFANGTIIILIQDVAALGAITITENGNIRVKGGTTLTMNTTTPYMFIHYENLWLHI